MPLRAFALSLLATVAFASVALASPSCPAKRFAPNARVQASELNGMFGKVARTERPVRAVYVAPSTEDPVQRRMIGALKARGAELGLTVDVVAPADPSSDAARLEVAKSALAGAPDVLLVSPVSVADLQPVLEEARTKNLPTIAIGARSPAARLSVDADQARLGAMSAEFLHELYPLGATVGRLQGPSTSAPYADRAKGFSEELVRYPSLVLADSIEPGAGRDKAREAVQRLVTAYPNIQGIYAENDEMALGAVDALKASGRISDVSVVGTGGEPAAMAGVKARSIKGTAARFPEKEGALAVEAALRLLQCQPIPPWIVSPQAMITAKNIEDYPGATQ
ncbi:substrate-binding domain-containing protein [Aureimonas psammosilenae]|uniref:substrate-binding domain-containing protein n=1 Tax=Aureimonas psammosilenae TaxID=2495496 RepID=UPI001260F780|nr:substrate-binding domain-containing protein [Aureimonas psammosilenae]